MSKRRSFTFVYIKKKDRVSAGFTRVDRVSPGQLPGGFLLGPGPVLGPGRPGPGSAGSRVDPPGRSGFQNYGPGSTRRAGPGFKTMLIMTNELV